MNSSSEPSQLASQLRTQPVPYVPLEYRESSGPFQIEDERPATGTRQPPATEESEPAADPAALLATRIEEERCAITAKARQEAEREIHIIRAGIANAIEQFAGQRDQYFHLAEEEVVALALAIARRLIHRESQIDPGLLAGLVNYELEQLEAATSVRLVVSPETLKYWSVAAHSMARAVEVDSDKSLAPGGIRIETALGSTSINFERELKEIERGFFDLLSHRPAIAETDTARVQ
ncbi:MAG: FliH/SctL family protein [Candidatus Korobacteraceae bacterium]